MINAVSSAPPSQNNGDSNDDDQSASTADNTIAAGSKPPAKSSQPESSSQQPASQPSSAASNQANQPTKPPLKTPQSMRSGLTGQADSSNQQQAQAQQPQQQITQPGSAQTQPSPTQPASTPSQQPAKQTSQSQSQSSNPYTPPNPSSNQQALKQKINSGGAGSAPGQTQTQQKPQVSSTNTDQPTAMNTPDGDDGGQGGGTNNTSGGDTGDTSNNRSLFQRFSPKMILGAVLLLILILGSGAGLYLSQQRQDIRQEAAISCGNLSREDCLANEQNGCSWTDNLVSCSDLDESTCNSTSGCTILRDPVSKEFVGCGGQYVDGGTCTGTYQPPEGEKSTPTPPAGEEGGETETEETQTTAPDCSSCVGSCSATGCSTQCDENTNPRDDCGIFPASFMCEGQREDGCNNLTGEAISAPDDYSDSELWCKTYQYDSNAPNNAATVVWVGDDGEVCREATGCNPDDLDWNCGEEVLSCNATCTSDEQCSAVNENYRCLPTFNYEGSFSNVTGNVSGVGSGTITALTNFVEDDGSTMQYLTRGGQLWHRPNFNSSWENVTGNVSSVGSGEITSFSNYVQNDGTVTQYLTRGGQIWSRPDFNSSWENVTGNVSSVGSGEITHFSSTQWGSNVIQYLVRGGSVYYRPNFSTEWQNVSGNISAGSGTITSFSIHINSEGNLDQFYARDGQLWHQEPTSTGDRCRLASSPFSASCNITEPRPTPTPTPTPEPAACNEQCDPEARNSVCADNLECISTGSVSRCRNPDYPDQINCQAPEPEAMCVSISMSPSEPALNDQVNFTCAQVEGVTNYGFRVIEPDGTTKPIQANGNTSTSYTINQSGTFRAECRLCPNGNCQSWPSEGGAEMCQVDADCQSEVVCPQGLQAVCSDSGACQCPDAFPTPTPTPTSDPGTVSCQTDAECGTVICPQGVQAICAGDGSCQCPSTGAERL